jgi:hypothetical protein
LWRQACDALKREQERFSSVLFSGRGGGWRTTETRDRRIWFHQADYPVRVWAVAIRPEGVIWADAEIAGVDNTYVRVRYSGEPVRLDRERLARGWTLYRNVFFSSSRSGYAARSFDEMWRLRYWRPGTVTPPAMQMPLADASSCSACRQTSPAKTSSRRVDTRHCGESPHPPRSNGAAGVHRAGKPRPHGRGAIRSSEWRRGHSNR